MEDDDGFSYRSRLQIGGFAPTDSNLFAESGVQSYENRRNCIPVPAASVPDTKSRIIEQCDYLKEFLLEKNANYGDSVFEPAGIFCKGLTPEQQLGVRIDDKLNRIRKGSEHNGDDTLLDLIGYLILLRIMRK